MGVVQKTEKIWLNGRFVEWDHAQTHVLTHTLHYGSGVFEGIRCYKTSHGTAIFRLQEHVDRLFNSATAINMKIPFTKEEVFKAITETVRVNKLESGYIRPVAYFGYGQVGLDTTDCNVDVAIICFPMGAYLGEDAIKNGIKVMVSKQYKRYFGPLNKAKINGNYYHSSLAKVESKKAGYAECIMLDDRNFVSEATGENLFIIQEGAVVTPKEGSILMGITRASVMQIARDLGIEVREQDLTRDDIMNADEAFFTGTAAEVTPINSIDGHKLKRINIASTLQKAYFDIVNGKNEKYMKWLTVV